MQPYRITSYNVCYTKLLRLSYEQRNERYDIFLLPALLLFCAGFILDQGKIFKIKSKRINWLLNKKLLVTIIISTGMIIVSNFAIFAADNTSDIEVAKTRITSYNVCYTKLLRSL